MMRPMIQVVIFENDPFTRKVIAVVLAENNLPGCTFAAPQDAIPADSASIWIGSGGEDVAQNDRLEKPVRIGALLDRVRWHILQAGQGAAAKNIVIGPYKLDCLNNIISDMRTGREIRLTEKERHILEVLERADGRRLERRALLEEVWGYADNIETHTLETHIYRLRQKIEADPAAPEILITNEQGYRLKI